jgi:anti-sigma regulatory factor (Ser/Thr protein kinase)
MELDLEWSAVGTGGRLRLRIVDSGPGFDPESVPAYSAGAASGRGIPLVRSLCSDLRYRGKANDVEAVYEW